MKYNSLKKIFKKSSHQQSENNSSILTYVDYSAYVNMKKMKSNHIKLCKKSNSNLLWLFLTLLFSNKLINIQFMISVHMQFSAMMIIKKYSNTEVLVILKIMSIVQLKNSVFKSEKMVSESPKSCKSFKTMPAEIWKNNGRKSHKWPHNKESNTLTIKSFIQFYSMTLQIIFTQS